MDRGASERVWIADVKRFFMEMVKNVTTCASQSLLQVSVGTLGCRCGQEIAGQARNDIYG